MSIKKLIGQLRINLEANTAEFSKGIKKGQKDLAGMASSVKVTAAKITGAIAGISAAFAGLGAGMLAKTAKDIDTHSKALGMAAGEYQVLTQAAQKYGVDADKVSDITKDLDERIGEFAQTGGGGLKDFGDLLAAAGSDLKIEDLIPMTPIERMKTIQGEMERLNVPLSQQRFIWESISGDASKLVPMLAQGAAELGNMQAHMLATGQILSDDVIADLVKLYDNASAIGGVMSGWGNIFVSGFAPQLASASTALLNFIASSEGIRNAFAAAGAAVGATITFISDNLGRIAAYATTAAIGIGIYGTAVGVAALATGGLTLALGVLRGALIASGVGLLAIAIGELVFRMSEWVSSIGGVSNAFTLMGNLAAGYFNIMKDQVSGLKLIFNGLGTYLQATFQGAFGAILSSWGITMQGIQEGLNLLIDAANYFGAGLQRLEFGDRIAASAQEQMDKAKASFAQGTADVKAGMAIIQNTDLTKPWRDATAAANEYGRAAYAAANMTRGIPLSGSGKDLLPPAPVPVTPPPPAIIPNLPTGGGGGGGAKKDPAGDKIKALEAELAKLNATWDKTNLQAKIWENQQALGANATDAQKASVANLVTQMDELERKKSALDNFKSSVSDLFGNIISGSMKAGDAIKQFAANILKNLASSALQNALSGIAGALGGGGWLGKAILGAFGANANGTNNWRGGLSLVGERGPEIVSMPQGSKVFNSQESRSMMNGSGNKPVLQVSLTEGVKAEWMDEASNRSAQITKNGLKQYDAGFNARIRQFQGDTFKK